MVPCIKAFHFLTQSISFSQQGNIQGPFKTTDMRQWHEAGYFKATLPMRAGEHGEFRPLQVHYPTLADAFLKAPAPQAAASPPQVPQTGLYGGFSAAQQAAAQQAEGHALTQINLLQQQQQQLQQQAQQQLAQIQQQAQLVERALAQQQQQVHLKVQQATLAQQQHQHLQQNQLIIAAQMHQQQVQQHQQTLALVRYGGLLSLEFCFFFLLTYCFWYSYVTRWKNGNWNISSRLEVCKIKLLSIAVMSMNMPCGKYTC